MDIMQRLLDLLETSLDERLRQDPRHYSITPTQSGFTMQQLNHAEAHLHLAVIGGRQVLISDENYTAIADQSHVVTGGNINRPTNVYDIAGRLIGSIPPSAELFVDTVTGELYADIWDRTSTIEGEAQTSLPSASILTRRSNLVRLSIQDLPSTELPVEYGQSPVFIDHVIDFDGMAYHRDSGKVSNGVFFCSNNAGTFALDLKPQSTDTNYVEISSQRIVIHDIKVLDRESMMIDVLFSSELTTGNLELYRYQGRLADFKIPSDSSGRPINPFSAEFIGECQEACFFGGGILIKSCQDRRMFIQKTSARMYTYITIGGERIEIPEQFNKDPKVFINRLRELYDFGENGIEG